MPSACLLLGGLLVLSGCQSDQETYVDRSVNDLYSSAKKYLDQNEYTKAAKSFAEVERQHPYSNWALRAQLMSAYSYYQAKKYDDAIDGFQTFIQLHPGHQDVAYAFYMVGLCYYEQIPIVQRDQQPAEKAMDAFNEVINRFKTSTYAKDARFKIDLLNDHLAAKEMDIGRFYESRGSTLAALNRFKVVVDRYAKTSQIEEALFRTVECYIKLGLINEATASAAVLRHNHPHSQWYRDAYALLKMPSPLVVSKKAKDASLAKKAEIIPQAGEKEKNIEMLLNSEETASDRADPLVTDENAYIAAGGPNTTTLIDQTTVPPVEE